MCSIIGFTTKEITKEQILAQFAAVESRGPDMTEVLETKGAWLGFARLAIMGLSPEGMQPFTDGESAVVCNGELYGFRSLKQQLAVKGYTFVLQSWMRNML